MLAPRFGSFRLRYAAFFTALTISATAAADPPAEPPAAPIEHDLPGPIPAAADKLGGHWMLRAGPLLSLPFGALDTKRDFTDTAGAGFGASADLGVGLTRSLVFGGWFEYAAFGGSESGCDCNARSLAFGPFARFHLVQGMRFDPWLSLGLGYRRIAAHGPALPLTDAQRRAGSSFDYSGFDARVELGGDWYMLSQVAFGPYAGLALGTLTERPSGNGGTVYGSFSAGLRVAFDVQGR
jgi:hypothetical protein